MITCHRSFLEARCYGRGYTLAEVMGCVVQQDGDQWTIDTESEHYPRAAKPGHQPQAVVIEPMPSRSAPGFLEKVKNFAVAAVSHVAAGLPMASDEEILRRHDICIACEFMKNDACTKCGCPVSRVRGYVSKLSWADQHCPIGKWGNASPTPSGPLDA